jgi:hypothetical protein
MIKANKLRNEDKKNQRFAKAGYQARARRQSIALNQNIQALLPTPVLKECFARNNVV